MKKIILFLFLLLGISINYSQNITNTLGTSGLFSIKDGSTTFLTLSQATGDLSISNNLRLPLGSLSAGVIFKGGVRFIHDFQDPATFGLNTFIGLNSGNFTMGGTQGQGSYNTGTGASTLTSLTTGFNNSAFGSLSMNSNTSGHENTALGFYSLAFNLTGSYNTATGSESLLGNSTGSGNSAFGFYSLLSNSTGQNNSAFGYKALTFNTTGYPNSAFGAGALYNNATGYENTAIGYFTLFNNVSGFQNTAVGDSALYYNTGNYNTAIGYNAGSNVTTGANLTLLGIDANPSSGSALDEITLGNIYVQHLRCNATTITSLSDKRDKKNIKDLNLGIDFLMKLKPRQYNWDKRDWYEGGVSDGTKMQKTLTAGFIAQELDSAQTISNAEWLNLVLKDNPDKWEATPGNLFPVIVKAIQELKEENDSLKAQVVDERELKEEIVEIKELKKELSEEIKYFEIKKRDQTIFSSLEIK